MKYKVTMYDNFQGVCLPWHLSVGDETPRSNKLQVEQGFRKTYGAKMYVAGTGTKMYMAATHTNSQPGTKTYMARMHTGSQPIAVA